MSKCVAVVLPCYKVREHILDVISRIGSEVAHIYVIDDCCPDQSGAYVKENCTDPRVRLVFNQVNLGVGGAVMAGYREAIKDGADIIVKIDGDGQMDPALLPKIIFPLLKGKADYAKGNRFYDLAHIRRMPTVRLIGNAGLSLISKLSTGYWQTFDPTNGYTAIDARVADHLPFERISQRYFFETDMLFRLNTLRAVVADVPMDACYGEEVSNLKIKDIIGEFFSKNMRNFFKRIFYNYFLRDMSLASLELLAGTALLSFGLVFGVVHWYSGFLSGQVTPTGTIMIASLSLLSGLQFMLAFFSYDIAATPTQPIGDLLLKRVHR
ncbi:glycosyltransferase family 2 protein [Pseudomonas sp. SO81]|uniref:glycosyltransferase family 2 protein n=1 Tax=Pseudomonas sp. SO81 TaxID=2983246 RepID=UPI0025A4C35C|nr:glycosyltransferase family 2 protein [Pseudomonas sp. SO81]WJN59463.1 Glycosyl transferase, group 2 family [Pseudomonas sp. SO81]